jgi:hypothetical protein
VVVKYLNMFHALPLSMLEPLLPPIARLVTELDVAPECAMALYRQVLRNVLQQWNPPTDDKDCKSEGNAEPSEEKVASSGKVDQLASGPGMNLGLPGCCSLHACSLID